MKLKFENPDPRTKNVYHRTGEDIEKAIRAALNGQSFTCETNAVQAVFSAFYNGMSRGYSGHVEDDGKAECGEYMATANPAYSTFNLYKKLV